MSLGKIGDWANDKFFNKLLGRYTRSTIGTVLVLKTLITIAVLGIAFCIAWACSILVIFGIKCVCG